MYYKVTNKDECHNGFQYSTGLNIDVNPFQETGSCVKGGLYFTTLEHITYFFDYGIYVREVTIPEDAKMVEDPEGDKWRADKIILGEKYSIENFIRKFKDKVDWSRISQYKKLSEDFIREFKDKVDWKRISRYQKLSEDFIREFKDQVNWERISLCQTLSEDFIREFKDKVDWDYISCYQKLSEDFIREFKDRLN